MPRTFAVTLALAATALAVLAPSPARSEAQGGAVRIVVLKEHGVGSPVLAQPYLDRFVAFAAKENGWADAQGRYYTLRAAAEQFIAAEKPHYGIFSLAPFLALRGRYKLEVIGQVAVKLVGGRQYYMISKSATSLASCKGKTLASDHVDDPRFVERVVADGAFRLAEYTLVQTQRPLQTTKKVLADEAVCALVDDAQVAELPHLEGADQVRTVWTSAELPPMVVVAFPAAPAAERKRFQGSLGTLCASEAKGACDEVGIVSLKASDAADYAAAIRAYGE